MVCPKGERSVTTHIRFGDKVYSPIIPDQETDALVAFEKVEAVRKPKTT